MRKICIPITSRAAYGRLKPVLSAILKNPSLKLHIIVCASALLPEYGDTITIMREDGFICDAVCPSSLADDRPSTMAATAGLLQMQLAWKFEELKPDIVLCHADRYETLAVATAAAYSNITLAHNQGGEITGSIDEYVRHAVTKLSHYHFTSTEKARRLVISLGEPEENVFFVGCPSIDLLKNMDLTLRPEFFDRPIGIGKKIENKPYILVLQHPVTTEYSQGQQIEKTLKAVLKSGLQAIFIGHNIDAGTGAISKTIRQFHDQHKDAPFHFYRRLSPEDYYVLLANAVCLVGNSSSGIREASYLGVPVINIGSRQSGREMADNVVNVPYNEQFIYEKIMDVGPHTRFPSSSLYGAGNAGHKMAEILTDLPPLRDKKLEMRNLSERRLPDRLPRQNSQRSSR